MSLYQFACSTPIDQKSVTYPISADYGEKAPFKATNRNRKNKNQHGRRRDCDATDRLWLQVHSNTLFTCSTISRYSGKGSRPLSTSPSSHPTLQLRTDAPDDLLDRPMSYTFNERAVVAGRLRNCLRTPATALVGLKQKWNDGHLRGTMIITSHLC